MIGSIRGPHPREGTCRLGDLCRNAEGSKMALLSDLGLCSVCTEKSSSKVVLGLLDRLEDAERERDAYRDSINNARKRLAVSEAGAWRYLVAALGIDGDDPLVDLSEETQQ